MQTPCRRGWDCKCRADKGEIETADAVAEFGGSTRKRCESMLEKPKIDPSHPKKHPTTQNNPKPHADPVCPGRFWCCQRVEGGSWGKLG